MSDYEAVAASNRKLRSEAFNLRFVSKEADRESLSQRESCRRRFSPESRPRCVA